MSEEKSGSSLEIEKPNQRKRAKKAKPDKPQKQARAPRPPSKYNLFMQQKMKSDELKDLKHTERWKAFAGQWTANKGSHP